MLPNSKVVAPFVYCRISAGDGEHRLCEDSVSVEVGAAKPLNTRPATLSSFILHWEARDVFEQRNYIISTDFANYTFYNYSRVEFYW